MYRVICMCIYIYMYICSSFYQFTRSLRQNPGIPIAHCMLWLYRSAPTGLAFCMVFGSPRMMQMKTVWVISVLWNDGPNWPFKTDLLDGLKSPENHLTSSSKSEIARKFISHLKSKSPGTWTGASKKRCVWCHRPRVHCGTPPVSRSWGVGTFPPRQGDILVDFLFFSWYLQSFWYICRVPRLWRIESSPELCCRTNVAKFLATSVLLTLERQRSWWTLWHCTIAPWDELIYPKYKIHWLIITMGMGQPPKNGWFSFILNTLKAFCGLHICIYIWFYWCPNNWPHRSMVRIHPNRSMVFSKGADLWGADVDQFKPERWEHLGDQGEPGEPMEPWS